MHILIPVVHRPTKPTGVCRHAVNLAKCLSEQNSVTKVTLITGFWQKHYFERDFNLNHDKINLLEIEIENNSISRNIWYIFGLPKLSNQLSPDIVHLSFPFPFIRTKFSCPVVSSIHDLYPYECPENFGFPQVWFNQLFLSQCIRNSDGLSCGSKVTHNTLEFYFKKVLKKKKSAVIYYYVDFSSIKSIPVNQEDELSIVPFFLSVAQHRKNKNLDLLIRSYSLLIAEKVISSDFKLVIVGNSGPETNNLLALVEELRLKRNILFLSGLSDEELCWLYKSCKLFVIPSSTEGFCFPLVEALSLGVDIVCSNIPIFREICQFSSCQYFDLGPNSVAELFKAMSKAIDLDRPKTGQLYHDSRFTKHEVAQRYLDFYNLFL